ncbi:MAG TPA: deoxyribonuclease IV [Thermoplasmata archaeon]|nr:deoxyribonuclease IV [Thermoplasmata archaeon]
MYLGAHIGIAEGLPEAVRELRRIGGESLQIFSKSPQMWSGPPLSPDAATAFRGAVVAEGIRATAVHHGYLINLASPKSATLKRSRRAFWDEIGRAEMLGVNGLIFHPGAHLGSGIDAGLATIAESLADAVARLPDVRVHLLLENAAGQGTALCSTLEELARVLAAVDAPGRLGVTLDTCHLFAAGNDFRDEAGYGRLRDRIDATIGRTAVRAFHLNDAKSPLGSHLDRHENIGRGEIGVEGFRQLVNDPAWAEVPGYLETPLDGDDYARYAADLATLRSLLAGAARPATARPRGRRRSTSSSTVK